MNRPPREFRRRLAAVWFADLVDYTGLAARDEDAALERVQALHAAAEDAVQRHGGRIVKRLGDAVMTEFPSAGDAVDAALALLSASPRRTLRVGVHVGEVTGAPDGDLYGDGVNLASRIQSAAGPDQVLISDDVARQLRRRREFRLEPVGPRALRGVAEPVSLFAVRAADAGADAGGGAAPQPPAARSIAVLPFVNLSPDPTNEYFSDGVTEEILTSLTQIGGLKVISRTSIMRYKGSGKDLRQIGAELGVETILEGSVRRAGDRVRITAQLIDARSDEHLWAERYDRQMEDIFAIQSDVAERIVGALKVRLTPDERARIADRPTDDLQAYQHYLKGLHFWNRRTPPDLRRACRCFDEAIGADPGFALAYAGRARAEVLLPAWDPGTDAAALERAREAAERALALDPGLPEAHTALGQIHLFSRRWEEAEAEFRRAIASGPGDATARQWYARLLAIKGRFAEAFEQVEQARELDPLALAVATEAGTVAFLARRYEQAIGAYQDAIELDPDFVPAAYHLAESLDRVGRRDEALDVWERLGALRPAELARGRAAVAAGEEPDLSGLLETSPGSGMPPSGVASTFAHQGRADEAFEWLERAFEGIDPYLLTLAVNPMFDPLRDDPRFPALLERLGLTAVPSPA